MTPPKITVLICQLPQAKEEQTAMAAQVRLPPLELRRKRRKKSSEPITLRLSLPC
jgi:hypothetical protein